MFQGYEFSFAGETSSKYGLFLADIGSKRHSDNPFGNKANIVETRLAKRVRPIHHGVRYNDEPLSFSLIFCSDKRMDRWELQQVALWLTGYQDYQWLHIHQPDMMHMQFRCLIQSLTPISVGWYPVAFEAKVICDCPYAYSYEFSQSFTINGETTVKFYNESTTRERLKPMMRVELESGCTNFSVLNRTSGRDAMELTGLPGSAMTFTVDNENMILTEETDGRDLYQYSNFRFLDLEPGGNELVFTGKGTVTLSGRFLYNVGA